MLHVMLQAMPQPPQSVLLDWRSTQVPLQLVWPAGQQVPLRQLPPEQSLLSQQLPDGMQPPLHSR